MFSNFNMLIHLKVFVATEKIILEEICKKENVLFSCEKSLLNHNNIKFVKWILEWMSESTQEYVVQAHT